MKKISLLFVLFVTLATVNLFGQSRHTEKCATVRNHVRNLERKPGLAADIARKEAMMQQWIELHGTGKVQDTLPAVIQIPVVVHVIYHTAAENIADSQIISQINRLNLDYRKLNSDTLATSHVFHSAIADAGFEFCLAQRDPNDSATTGITRTQTNRVSFNSVTDADDYMKFTATGGIDAWDPHKYLNIWVVNIDTLDGTLGYTSYPSDLDSFPEYDGSVIDYHYFGSVGPAVQAPLDLGRTATHEIGHWLYLVHIWGDANCASDSVADTPTQADANFGCPTFPNVTCSNGPNGDMYMNYMDYTDDNCMNMFTHGQATRMRAAFATFRTSILSGSKCQAIDTTHVGISELSGLSLQVIPNPSDGNMTVKVIGYSGSASMALYDMTGREVWSYRAAQAGTNVAVQVADAAPGVYIMKVMVGSELRTRKIIIR